MSKTETRSLPVVLTEVEVHDRSQELARTVDEINDVEAEKKDVVKDFAKRLGEKRKRMNELANAITSGTEKRDIECSERVDERRHAIEIIRHDTLEVVETRPMTGEQIENLNQGHLFDRSAATTTEPEIPDAAPTETPPGYVGDAPEDGTTAATPEGESEVVKAANDVGAPCEMCGETNGHRLECPVLTAESTPEVEPPAIVATPEMLENAERLARGEGNVH